ncbi:MAG: ProQ/FinO family protein [Zoogloeaceae bacterium]|jgi:ProP effector|nr:ProQ/FinO family protein [Zoogloeaceae bacterium]
MTELSNHTPEIDVEAAPDIDQTPRALLKILAAQFPVFHDCLPLSIGIDKVLLARLPSLKKKSLRAALALHTHSIGYLRATGKATHRFDLDGNPAEEINGEHRQYANDILNARLKVLNEKRRMHEKTTGMHEKTTEKTNRKKAKAPVKAEKLALLAEKFAHR